MSSMSAILNLARMIMLVWVVFALVFLFRPSLLNLPPNPKSAIIQAVVAFALGHLIERALGASRRKQAETAATEPGQI
jgi:uncharacterized protein YhhL (DUF1145 family)